MQTVPGLISGVAERFSSLSAGTAAATERNPSRSLGLLRRRRGRHRLLKARSLGKALVIGRKGLCRRYSAGGFRKLFQIEQDRHHVDVGEGEAPAGEEAVFGNGTINEADLLLERRRYGIDRLSIGRTVTGFRENVVEQIGTDQCPIHS